MFDLLFRREPIERAVFIEFVLLALLLPAIDYRGEAFFVLMGLSVFGPFLLALVVLAFLTIWIGLTVPTALQRSRVHGVQQLLAFICVATLAILLGCFIAGLFAPMPTWIAHSTPYQASTGAIAQAAIFCAPIVAIAIPMIAITLAAWSAIRRKLLAAAGYVAVPLLALSASFIGHAATDHLTVASCTASMRAAIRSRDSAPMTREPDHMTTTIGPDHEIAVCALDSPLFLAEYIVDDPLDKTPDTVAKRVGAYLDSRQCSVGARRVERYYWVDEAC